MKITNRTKLSTRMVNFGFAFVVALSAVTASGPFLFSKKADALPFTQYAVDTDKASISVRANTSDISTITAHAEFKGLIGGWQDFMTPGFTTSTITASVPGGEVSVDGNSWNGSTATKTVNGGLFGKHVLNTFYFRAQTVGTHTITFTAVIPSTEGQRTLTKTATLNAAPINFTAPQPTAPQNGGLQNTKNTTFGWNGVADAQKYEVRISKSPARAGGGNDGELNGSDAVTLTPVAGTTLNNVLNEYGTWFWQVRAIAGAQKGPWSNIWSTKLNQAPSVNFVAPTPLEDSYVRGTISAHVQASDDYGMSSYFIRVWKNAFESGLSNLVKNDCYSAPGGFILGLNQDIICEYDTTTNADGKYVLSAQFLDGDAATWGSALRTVNVDNTKPTSTNDLQAYAKGSVTVSQTVSDNYAPQSGKLGIWKLNTDGSQDNSKFFSIGDVNVDADNKIAYQLNTVTNLYGDGKYLAKFTATDVAGNASVSQKELIVDNSVPVIAVKNATWNDPSVPTVSSGSTVSTVVNNQLRLFTTDANIDRILMNGNTQWSGSWITSAGGVGISYITSGTHTFQAVDKAGNVSEIVTLTFDNIAPNVPAHDYPAADVVIDTNDFWFEWNDATDAVKYELQNSQSPLVNTDGSFQNVQWTGDYQGVQPTESKAHSVGANGTWYWQVRSVDAAGNKSAWTAPWKVTIDMNAPVVTMNGYTSNSNVITPNLVTTDDTDLTYEWDGSYADVTVSATDVLAPTFTVNKDGTYTYTLTVTDAAGNATEKTFTFTYTAPVVINNNAVNTVSNVVALNNPNISTVNAGNFSAVALADAPANNANDDTSGVLGENTKNDDSGDKDQKVLAATKTPEINGDSTVLGLAWYWWIPIALGIGAAAWWLLAAYRRQNADA